MLAGLSVVGLALQPPLEAALLRALTALGCDAFLYAVAVKNLSGHRTRNTQTAAMVGLAAAFLIFASAMFTLQVRVGRRRRARVAPKLQLPPLLSSHCYRRRTSAATCGRSSAATSSPSCLTGSQTRPCLRPR